MLFGDFKSLLRGSIKRGEAYNDQLGGFARRAARWIEQNYTLQYMRRRITLTGVLGDDSILLPTNVPIKSLEYIRFQTGDGTRYECSKGDLSDPEIEWLPRGVAWNSWRAQLFPSHFYLDGVEAIVFNRPFTEALPGVGMMARYSDFPTADNQTHWLLRNAEGLMLRQAMLEFMTDARDDRGYQATLAKREEDIRALLNADYDVRYTGQNLQL